MAIRRRTFTPGSTAVPAASRIGKGGSGALGFVPPALLWRRQLLIVVLGIAALVGTAVPSRAEDIWIEGCQLHAEPVRNGSRGPRFCNAWRVTTNCDYYVIFRHNYNLANRFRVFTDRVKTGNPRGDVCGPEFGMFFTPDQPKQPRRSVGRNGGQSHQRQSSPMVRTLSPGCHVSADGNRVVCN